MSLIPKSQEHENGLPVDLPKEHDTETNPCQMENGLGVKRPRRPPRIPSGWRDQLHSPKAKAVLQRMVYTF